MKRLTLFSKLILFLSSYIPLGIICLIIDFESFKFPFFKHHVSEFSLLVLILSLPILLFLFIRYFRKRPTGKEQMNIISVKNMDSEILSYIFTYILPFLGFPEGRRIYIIVFLLFIIGILYIRSDMIGINPLLSIFGYHILKVEWTKNDWEKSKEVTLISRFDYFHVKHCKYVDAIQIQNDLYLLRGVEND